MRWSASPLSSSQRYCSVSAYFEVNREAYYEGLRSISRDDDWSGWCELFLDAVRAQAEDNLVKTEIDPARGQRPALFVFRRLLDVAEGRKSG